MEKKYSKDTSRKQILGLIWIVAALMALTTTAAAVTFEKGDIFAGVGTGFIKHFNSTGGLIETLNTNTTCSEQLGMAFDAAGNLYATSSFGCPTGHVVKFNNASVLIGPFGSNYSSSTESIAIDKAQNVYVGQPDGTKQILKFDPNGTLLANFSPATNRGTDWIDLASDQCTIYYTSEGTDVKRYDVCNDTQLPDFNTETLPNGTAYALRILPDGGVIVADSEAIVRLDNTGSIIATYPKDDNETSFLFALNIDPDGQHFWTAGYNSGNIYKYAFVPVGPPVFSFNANKLGCCVSGLAVFGELVAATPQLGNISGMKFNDLNGNGMKDAGEPGLANWTIMLTRPDGTNMSVMTDSSGSYTFSGLQAVNYTVEEVPETGWIQTAPPGGKYSINLSASQNVTGKDFGNMVKNVTAEVRRPTEIIDNMSGVPVINESTIDIFAEDFMNFSAGDPYMITITKVTDGSVEFNASGTLIGGPKQTIKVDWIPQGPGAYILRSEANTTADARIVEVINQKVISPIPELSTIALVSAGLLGLFGLVRKRR